MVYIEDPRIVDLIKDQGHKARGFPESQFLSNSRRRGHIVSFVIEDTNDEFRAIVLTEHTLGERRLNLDGNGDSGTDLYRLKICDSEFVVFVCIVWHGQRQNSAWVMSERRLDEQLN